MANIVPARVLVVDGMSLLKTTPGMMAFLDNGLSFNFFSQLTSVLKKFPDIVSVVVCWEGGFTERTEIMPEYKASRVGSNEDVKNQRRIVQELLSLMGIKQAMAHGHEGDDVGAWMTHNLGTEVLLLSNDKDWLQLVKPGVSIFQKTANMAGKKPQKVEINVDNFEILTGWPSPALYLKAKCVAGDKDEVPGLAGVGEAGINNYLRGMDVPPNKKKKIDDFIGSEEFQRNMLLADLITPKNLQIVWLDVFAPDKDNVQAWLADHKWNKVLSDFDTWWDLWQKVA